LITYWTENDGTLPQAAAQAYSRGPFYLVLNVTQAARAYIGLLAGDTFKRMMVQKGTLATGLTQIQGDDAITVDARPDVPEVNWANIFTPNESVNVIQGNFESRVETAPPAPTCGGKQVGGYCWYAGGSEQSCDTVCLAQSLACDLTGLQWATAKSPCELVLVALGIADADGSADLSGGFKMGCWWHDAGGPPPPLTWMYDNTVTCAMADVGGANDYRACACH
jgi:hypothetical protein